MHALLALFAPAAAAAATAPLVTPRHLLAVKALLASSGALLLLIGAWLVRHGRADAFRRLRDALLAFLGLVSLAAWFNFGLFHLDHYHHLWDVYHYYFGAKYFPELSYTRLYRCTAQAEIESGRGADVAGRRIRNLASNRLEGRGLDFSDPGACRTYFAPERWEAFRRDVAFFRGKLTAERWSAMALDHGYNATPVWTLVGGFFANLGPASDRQLLLLGLIDPALVILIGGLVVWAFGWRASAVAALFFGTLAPADFGWIGGCFMRLDWLAASVAAICFLKRGFPAAAGAALAYATLLRVFPAFLGAGLVLAAVAGIWKGRRFSLSAEHRRFALGALLTVAILAPLSALATRSRAAADPGPWRGFVGNSEKHLGSPSMNNLGLRTALSWTPEEPLVFTPDQEPVWVWWGPKQQAFERRKPLFWALLAGYVLLLARAAPRHESWAAAALSAGLVPVAATLSGYYYALLLVFGFLWVERESFGAALAALAALSCLLPLVTRWDYDAYVLFSAVAVAFAFGTALAAGRAPGPRTTRDEPRSS